MIPVNIIYYYHSTIITHITIINHSTDNIRCFYHILLSWFITSITLVYGGYIELVNGVYKPTYNWGAQPCRVPPHMGLSENRVYPQL